jgi:hypothetical protein
MAFHADGQWCIASGCYTRGTLAFTNGTNTCAAALNGATSPITVERCSGTTGIEWAEQIQNGHIHFANTHASTMVIYYLTGFGNGSGLVLDPQPGPSGSLEAWDFL